MQTTFIYDCSPNFAHLYVLSESRYTGKERDQESGLDYFGARYLNSNMGRFMSPDDGSDQDPSDPQSWNLYSYVQNNPTRNVDPDGHDCVTQTRTSSTSENVSVSSGGCSGAAGNGTTQTYVDGTVKIGDIHAGSDGHSIDIGSTGADGSSTTTNANSAPVPDNPGIALGYNQAGYSQMRNTAGVVNYVGGIGLAVINTIMDAGVLNSTMPETGALSGVGTPAVKMNWAHNLLNPRPGHLPPPGSPDVVQGAVQAALKAGQYSTDGNGVIHGSVQILGTSCGFDGKMVNGIVRISTVYAKF
jgi:RHS repeat-associated protein